MNNDDLGYAIITLVGATCIMIWCLGFLGVTTC
jgi:hypothetical protein